MTNTVTGGTLALEYGNLAAINAKLPQLGQSTTDAAIPVILPTAQVTALTPPTTIGIGNTPTVNIGTGGTLALESGNLASINAKLPQLGQALSASSVPVVLPVSQVTALTPPTTIGIGNTPTVNIGTGGTLALESGNLASINTKLPTSLGSKSATTSLSVVQSYASTSTNSSVSSGT